MKHLSQLLFAGALLLGSLIMFHHQKSEPAGDLRESAPVALSELAAELPVQRISETDIQLISLPSFMSDQTLSGDLRNTPYPHAASCRMRMKAQMDIYLELKPVLDLRSGRHISYPSGDGDPPGFCS